MFLEINEKEVLISILAARLVDHANFLRNTITNAGKGIRTTSHHECAFGKWYHANTSKYSDLLEYRNIDDPHRRVHDAAEAISNNCTVENAEALVKASVEILEAFVKLAGIFKNSMH